MLEKRLISLLLPVRIEGDVIHVFLQKRSADMKVLPNHFGFWGGGVEGGETSEQGLVREIREELGVELDITKVETFNRYEFLRSVKDVYTFTPPEGWEDGIVIGEGEYGKWFRVNEALERSDIIFEDKVILQDLERAFLKRAVR